MEEHPAIIQYIDGINTLHGHGWSIGFKLVNFGLTLSGIRQSLRCYKEAIPVIETPQAFQTFINEAAFYKPTVAIVVSSLFYSPELNDRYGLHVFAIAYEKTALQHILHIYDSEANKDYDGFEQYFGKAYQVNVADTARQQSGDYTCHAFAIHDARLIQSRINKGLFKTFTKGLFKTVVESTKSTINSFFSYPRGAPVNLMPLDEEFFLDAIAYKRVLFAQSIQYNLQNECVSDSTWLTKNPRSP